MRLASIYSLGHVVSLDLARATTLIKQACDGAEMSGCLNLAIMSEQGRGVARDPKLAAELYQRACDQNIGSACAGLAFMHDEGHGVEKDQAAARREYGLGCDHHYFAACTRLGFMLELGLGGEKDDAAAAKIFARACGGAEINGCEAVARRNALPAKSEADCQQRAGPAAANCVNDLGVALIKDRERNPDGAVEGVTFFEKACELGSAIGCGNLGAELLYAKSIAPDALRGVKLITEACNTHHVKASCDYLHSLPAWAQDPSTFPPAWAKDGPLEAEGPGCNAFRRALNDQSVRGSGPTPTERRLSRLKQGVRPEAIDKRIWDGCLELTRKDVVKRRAEIDAESDGVFSTGSMKNSSVGSSGGSSPSSNDKAKEMACKVDCGKRCRARSPGDPCMVSINKCKRACQP